MVFALAQGEESPGLHYADACAAPTTKDPKNSGTHLFSSGVLIQLGYRSNNALCNVWFGKPKLNKHFSTTDLTTVVTRGQHGGIFHPKGGSGFLYSHKTRSLYSGHQMGQFKVAVGRKDLRERLLKHYQTSIRNDNVFLAIQMTNYIQLTANPGKIL